MHPAARGHQGGPYKNKIDANTMSEEDTEKVNELLDQADAQCTEGDLAKATETLTAVNKIVGK